MRDNINWMSALARRMLKDQTLAESAVQDGFISAFRDRIGIESEENNAVM